MMAGIEIDSFYKKQLFILNLHKSKKSFSKGYDDEAPKMVKFIRIIPLSSSKGIFMVKISPFLPPVHRFCEALSA